MKIPWFLPQFGEEEAKAVLQVLQSNYINDGPFSRKLEERFCEYLNVKHAVAVTNGTSAITLSLMALGIGPGDEVIVPDVTFIATANAVRLTGAEVVLADVEDGRFGISLDSIKSKITAKTKAIVPVDVNGRGANYENLIPFARNAGLKIVCDSAEALGSKYHGQFLGTYGEAGCFSFSANKTVTSGQGGMIVTDSSELHDRLRELKDQGRRFQGSGGDDLHPVMGYNFKYTDLQAAVCFAQFEKLGTRLKKSKQRDQWYRKYLRNNSLGIVFPETLEEEVLQWTDIRTTDKRDLSAKLKSHDIGHRSFWLPLHTQKPYQTNGPFPASEKVSREGLWLPSHFDITEEQVNSVCEIIQKG